MINTYLLGNEVQLNVAFTNNGAPVSPSGVNLEILRPDQGIDTPSLTNMGGGNYYTLYTPSMPGTYYCVFEATGTAIAAVQEQFNVIAPII